MSDPKRKKESQGKKTKRFPEIELLHEALRISEQKLQAIIDAVPIPLFFKDVRGVFVNCNQAYADFWGLPRGKILGSTAYDIAPPELAEIYSRADSKLLEQRGTQVYEAQVRHADQSLHTVTLYRSALEDTRKEVLGIVGAMIDITKTKEIENKLRELSLTDELTGLNNRRGFFMLAAQQIKNAARFKQSAALLYADLDNMKWINDKLGHTEGDRALVDFAALFKSSFRASDIVARLGGDEFVGLALESGDSSVEMIMARLHENLTARNIQESRSYQLALSLGVVRWDPKNPCSLDELLERGDKLMYEQKQIKKEGQDT